MRLDKLTPEQEARVPHIRDEWLKVGLSTEPADRKMAEEGVKLAYAAAGLAPPKIVIWLDSPQQGAIAFAMLTNSKLGPSVRASVRDSVWDSVRAAAYGSHDAHWIGFYAAIAEFGVHDSRLDGLHQITRSCGWWWPFAGAVILTDRPETIRQDDQNRLHCEDGPAVRYRDGFSVYSWRGTRFPSEWITDKISLTAKIALTWKNLEQRRVAIEIIGWDRVLRELKARVIDADADPQIGTLLEVNLPDLDAPSRFVRLECGTGRTFAVCVPSGIPTAIAGQAWMMGKTQTDFLPPEIRT